MRICGGDKKGLRLQTLRGKGLRPTSEKVREALFDILGGRIVGARVADFYAGTGGIGIEALSRGAAHVAFIERHGPSLKILKTNLRGSGLASKASIYPVNAMAFLSRTAQGPQLFDILFADPPYHDGSGERFLARLAADPRLTASGLLILEHFHKTPHPQTLGSLERLRVYRYGETMLSLYQPKAMPSSSATHHATGSRPVEFARAHG